MRSKFIALVLLVPTLLFGMLLWLKPAPAPLITAAMTTQRAKPELVPSNQFVPTEKQLVAAAVEKPVSKLPLSLSAEAREDRLMELSRKKEAGALAEIILAFSDPDKEVRETAMEAAKQLGDANAIPALKYAAEQTDDLEEKIDFLETADFLATPSLAFNDSGGAKVPDAIKERHRSTHRKLEN